MLMCGENTTKVLKQKKGLLKIQKLMEIKNISPHFYLTFYFSQITFILHITFHNGMYISA